MPGFRHGTTVNQGSMSLEYALLLGAVAALAFGVISYIPKLTEDYLLRFMNEEQPANEWSTSND